MMTGLPATTGALALQLLEVQAGEFLEQKRAASSKAEGLDYDPEHVHQMRVATRRMRAALRLFTSVLPPEASRLNDELKWIAGQLGPARDLDVQLQQLRETAAALALTEAAAPYADWLDEQRQRAQHCLDQALGSTRFAALAETLSERLGTALSPNSEADALVPNDAPRLLTRAYKALEKRGDKLDEHSPAPRLHAVRIRAKRLRYAAEFFEPAYGKPARRLIKRVVRLQDLLGALQDTVVSTQHIHEAVEAAGATWRAETSLALGQILQHDAQRAIGLRKAFRKTYKDVKASWKRLPRDLRQPTPTSPSSEPPARSPRIAL
jgi:CHAD domain-containing protein